MKVQASYDKPPRPTKFKVLNKSKEEEHLEKQVKDEGKGPKKPKQETLHMVEEISLSWATTPLLAQLGAHGPKIT